MCCALERFCKSSHYFILNTGTQVHRFSVMPSKPHLGFHRKQEMSLSTEVSESIKLYGTMSMCFDSSDEKMKK